MRTQGTEAIVPIDSFDFNRVHQLRLRGIVYLKQKKKRNLRRTLAIFNLENTWTERDVIREAIRRRLE